ncbi:MAG: hypothetical protein EHM45_23795 [Desulfobacteraceae bacterium]|nr:MAG: hypothetical protein EHM45_23795 [Desulfobacteraceae bacterium]
MTQQLLKTVIFVLLLLFVFMFFQAKGVAAGDRVPVELAQKAALLSANDIFGPVSCVDHAIYYNLADEPAVYVFTFSRKPGPLPGIDTIKSKVNAARTKRLALEKDIDTLSLPEKTAKIMEIQNYWQEMRQEENFVTVTASATYTQVPVIEIYAGLPPHVVALEDAKALATTVLDKTSLHLAKLRYPASLRFEFEFSDSSGKCVLVSPLDFKIRDISLSKQEITDETGIDAAQARVIAKEWETMKNKILEAKPDSQMYSANDPGNRRTHAANLTGTPVRGEGPRHDPQVFRGYLPQVPDYQKIDYEGQGDCAPTAAACVLGYWSTHGYPNLLDSGNVPGLVREIEDNSDFDFVNGGASLESITESFEIFANDPDVNNNYGFAADYNRAATFFDYENEILTGRPVIHNGSLMPYGKHSLAGVGFVETLRAQWCIDHDNWASTPANVYIEWNALRRSSLITVVPGNANNKILAGYARTSGGSGIPGVQITFMHYDYQGSTWVSDGAAISDQNGYYSFSAYYCWNGRAEPLKSSFTFSPAFISYDDITSEQVDRNYTGAPIGSAKALRGLRGE